MLMLIESFIEAVAQQQLELERLQQERAELIVAQEDLCQVRNGDGNVYSLFRNSIMWRTSFNRIK